MTHPLPRWPRALRLSLALVVLAATFVFGGASALAAGNPAGAVYTLTNDPAGNAVAVFERAAGGALTPAGSYATGGLGTGAALGSQGALTLSRDGRWLLAVNAGSDSVSVFLVGPHAIGLTDTVASGGDMPISVTIAHDVVYVLNAGSGGNISGFTLRGGKLTPLVNSTRPLSGRAANVGPAQVQFNPAGDALVVTEKATNTIDTYAVGQNGLAAGPHAYDSNGATPFGFDFTPQGTLVVSDAVGGAADASAVSTYRLLGGGAALGAQDGPVGTTETAACWVVTSKNGKYAYAINAGSDSISGYAVDNRGQLTLLDADGQTGLTGGHPTDSALSGNGQYLYTLNNTDSSISMFRVNADGSLASLGTLTGVPGGAVGLASR